jgi:hypothetical protein
VLSGLCAQELPLSRTTKKHLFLELMLTKLCQPRVGAIAQPTFVQSVNAPITSEGSPWRAFVQAVDGLDDPLLKSIFSQGRFKEQQGLSIIVEFPEQLAFFADWLADTRKVWEPILQQYFSNSSLNWSFSKEVVVQKLEVQTPRQSVPVSVSKPAVAVAVGAPAQNNWKRAPAKKIVRDEGKPLDVSDTERWRTTNLVLTHFPGTPMVKK